MKEKIKEQKAEKKEGDTSEQRWVPLGERVFHKETGIPVMNV